MPTIKINEGQTLLDIAVQHCGNVEKAFELALANGLDFNEDLVIGDEMVTGEVAVEKRKLVELFKNKILVPASKKDDYETMQLEGVDYWSIGTEFIIS